jgi:hypothetical protein
MRVSTVRRSIADFDVRPAAGGLCIEPLIDSEISLPGCVSYGVEYDFQG